MSTRSPRRWSSGRSALKVGNGLEAGIDIGPSIDEKQLEIVLDYVGIGSAKARRLNCGGERLTDGRARARLLLVAGGDDRRRSRRCASRRKRFSARCSPCCLPRNLDHAIEIANGIRFGLSAGDLHASLTSAYEFINRIEAGLVMVNLPSAGVEYHVPFGGSKASSMGMREQGPVAVDFYTEIQTAYLKY